MSTAGKTAPKLVHDFLRFDPQNSGTGNCLIQHPLPSGEGTPSAPSSASCRHEYSLKTVQSVLPPQDSRPQAGTQYKTALLCPKCMIHADILISYPHTHARDPCPNADNPLHHLQYQKDRENVNSEHIRYGWRCSIEGCHAEVTISFRRTRISKDRRELLAGRERLQQRFNEASQADPDRNVKLTTPTAAMNILQRYLKDALDPTVEKRRLMANNKLFKATYGVDGRDCGALLTEMGFVFHPAQDETEAQWTLPDPPPIKDRLHADGTSPREMLEDMEAEAIAWTGKLAFDSGEMNPAAARALPSANREVERVVGAQNYPTRITLKQAPLPNDLAPYFASLGALPNFTDGLLEFAYDRQVICDPALSAYYLECIQAISEHRGTEQLQIKVATLQSQDLVSRRDLRAAYRSLDLKETDSDEHIINKFSVRQSNCGTQVQEENRAALAKIGMSRQSPRLTKAAKQELETYEDALSWLGADKTMDESLIHTLLSVKTLDSPSEMETARKAASIISKARGGSSSLDDWLAGRQPSHGMSANEALRHLNITTDLESLDQSLLDAIFVSARVDRPGTQTDQAIAAIQKALSTPSVSRPPELWPVGLTSHGNTCYLNSLLQYYFSIQPLRDIVLEYDKYKLDTTKTSEKAQRVGQRIITTVEIQGGQKFADDLKHLFQRMIKDRQRHIKPEADLVCRAFLEPKDYALLTSEVRGEKQDAKVNGENKDAQGAGVDTTMEDDTPKEASGVEETQQSDASSITLVGDEQDIAMKDNDSPPTPPGSPTQKPVETVSDKPEPTEPPPLPPRRFSTTKEQALLKAEQKARQQQDVTEVHDGAMFRLRSGMIAKGMDERGEQQDELRDIFEISLKETTVQEDGSEKETTVQEDGSERLNVEASSSIMTDVPNESTDVYTLLDKVFDLQDISGTNKTTYKTIQTAPPLLQIAIPRIGYDTNRGAFKSEELVLLHDELYLDRYMDDYEGQVLPKRRTCWGWRKQLRAWKQERNSLSKTIDFEIDGPTALTETAAFVKDLHVASDDLDELGLGGIEVEPDLADELEAEAVLSRHRITELQQEIDDLQAKFTHQFADLKNFKYELASVFIHRGGNASGHYWIYIRDFAKDCWRKYNDEEVTELTNDEFHALIQSPVPVWANGTPTYAVYVREGDKLGFVQPVCRQPEEVPEISVWTQDSSEKVTEGGKEGWDPARQVADVQCTQMRLRIANERIAELRLTNKAKGPTASMAPLVTKEKARAPIITMDIVSRVRAMSKPKPTLDSRVEDLNVGGAWQNASPKRKCNADGEDEGCASPPKKMRGDERSDSFTIGDVETWHTGM